MSEAGAEPAGVLLVDKPRGITSHDVVDSVRRLYRTRRVGHAGTLDPMATGLLIVLVGKATKASDQLMAQDKEYLGEATLGVVTDTQDAEGETLETNPVPEITEAQVRAALASMLGDQLQVPPMHSAKKIGGQKLYDLARKGIEVAANPARSASPSSSCSPGKGPGSISASAAPKGPTCARWPTTSAVSSARAPTCRCSAAPAPAGSTFPAATPFPSSAR